MTRVWNKHKQIHPVRSRTLSNGAGTSLKKKVFVGLSGGVDSAVAAALLKKDGYEVAGVFMRFWRPFMGKSDNSPRPSLNLREGEWRGWENSCCSVESEAAARLIAAKLKIPFYVFDFAKEFKREVVDYFLTELRAGRTPNPCVVCNPQIKFGLFLERAKKLGADFVATGHYAKIAVIARSETTKQSQGNITGLFCANSLERIGARNDIFKLFSAKDKQKDQSYFLHRLTQEQLSKIIWPLGDYTKEEVYQLAKQWRLPYWRHESFDICFAGDYKEFLRRYVKMKLGRIIKINNAPRPPLNLRGGESRKSWDEGELLGEYHGLPFYTIGQRAAIGGPGPFYVVKKDLKKNILYVSNNERDLYQKEMTVKNVNWLAGEEPKLPLKCKVKIRYGGEAAEALVKNVIASPARAGRSNPVENLQNSGIAASSRSNGTPRKDTVIMRFVKSQRAPAPGQSAVFYGRKGEILGGGIIL